jgi:hypothetical protein
MNEFMNLEFWMRFNFSWNIYEYECILEKKKT